MSSPEEFGLTLAQPDILDLTELSRHAGAFTLGATLSLEETTPDAREYGYLSDEFIKSHEAHFVVQTRRAFGGCGDDRGITEQSADDLAGLRPEAMRADEAYASVFGGAAGIAKNILIAYIGQHGIDRGRELIAQVGGFEGMLRQVVATMGADEHDQAVIPILHSAEGNENEDGTFCMHGTSATGCAYCAGVGATSALLLDTDMSFADGLTLADVAEKDQLLTFGEANHANFSALLAAHQVFLSEATVGTGSGLTVSRQTYIDQINDNVPVMILAGSHAAVRDTGIVHNFVLGDIGSANKANQDAAPFYRQDIAQITAAVLRNFPQFEIDPEMLMRAFMLDSTPVRSVLVSHDAEQHGNLDPRNLAMGARGNPWVSIEQIRLALAA